MHTKTKRILLLSLIGATVLACLLLLLLPAGESSYADQLLIRCGLSARVGENTHKMVFLDVGQGDCTLLLSGGQAALIDTGTGLDDGLSLVEELQRLGVVSIDALLLSHPHSDHIGGAEAVLNAFPVGRIYCSQTPPEESADAQVYSRLQSAAEDAGVPFTDYPTETLTIGGFTIEFLFRDDYLPEENDRSQFVKVSGFGFTALFTGDAGQAAESSILHSGLSLQADLLKVGHHGSNTSAGGAFLAAVQPRFAVIQVGKNGYGHPADGLIDRLSAAGCEVFRTDVNGTVTFDFSDGLAVSVKQ